MEIVNKIFLSDNKTIGFVGQKLVIIKHGIKKYEHRTNVFMCVLEQKKAI